MSSLMARVAYRNPLTVFTTDADGVAQVASYHFHYPQNLGPVSRKGCTPHHGTDFAVFEQVALCHVKNKIPGGCVDLASPHFLYQEPVFSLSDNLLRVGFTRRYICVSHSWHRFVLVRLPSPMAVGGPAFFGGRQAVV